MTPRKVLYSLALALSLSGCGDDGLPQPIPEPDLLVSGRLIDDLGQPLAGGTVEAWLVSIPAAASVTAAVLAPSCDGAEPSSNEEPDDAAGTASDGSFSLSLVGLDQPLCLVIGVREAGQPEGEAVRLAPRLVSPGSTTPVTLSLGDVAIGRLDAARH